MKKTDFISRKQYLFLSLALIIGILLVYQFLLKPIVVNAYHGESFSYLNSLIRSHILEDPDMRDLSYYKNLLSNLFLRLTGLISLALVFGYFALFHLKNHIKNFFQRTTHPLNLAITRISVFSVILSLDFFDSVIQISRQSADAVVPPPGWNTILNLFPINPEVTGILVAIFFISCITGLLGLFTRTSCIIAAISGLFVMGIPQFYGKINHYHFLWQFLVILALSPSGDALSVDSIFKSFKYPRNFSPKPSQSYALPLTFMWLTIGLVYFFPGFWKFLISGFDWAFSENLKFKMYNKWFALQGWVPAFRIDHYPFLYQSAAFFTIFFELTFIFALPFKKLRHFFIPVGLLFHTLIAYFMRIFFIPLMWMYVSFINWDKLFNDLRQKVQSQKLKLSINANNPQAESIKNSFQNFNYLNTFQVNISDQQFNQLFVIQSVDKTYTDWKKYFILVFNNPFYLILLPFLFPLHLVQTYWSKFSTLSKKPVFSYHVKSIVIGGTIITILNVGMGATLFNTWPFSVYPTFAATEQSYTKTILLEAYRQEEKLTDTIPILNQDLSKNFQSAVRLRGFVNKIMNAEQVSASRLQVLIKPWLEHNQLKSKATTVKVIRIKVELDPDNNYQNYTKEKKLKEITIQ